MKPRHAAIPALALTLAAAAWAAAPADTPASYASRWPLQLPAAASTVRLALPAEVLTQLQTADLRDLRVFNAAGQPVPLALDRAGADSRAPAPPPIALPALPVRADAPAGTATSGLSLRIDEGPGGRVVTLDAAPTPSSASTPASAASAPGALVGALVDTRAQKAPLQAIELDADWPAARAFTFRLYASADLRQWQPLGEVTTYRGGDGAVTAPARVALDGVALHERYLRIGWDAAAPGAVQLRGVRLLPQPPLAAPTRLAVPLALPAGPPEAGALQWRLPFATPLAALDIRADGGAALVPVRVLVRQQREQPWTPLARHVVFSLAQDGALRHSPAIELGQAAWREWRVEADAASPGFATPPQVTAWLAPAQIVFVASGQPPFTLAAGRADAPATALPLASLMPGYEPGAQARLPAASLAAPISASTAAPTAVATTGAGDGADTRRWLLWAVLVAGVLALGAMAWRLMKTPPEGASADPGRNA
jgi:hypothetical protein